MKIKAKPLFLNLAFTAALSVSPMLAETDLKGADQTSPSYEEASKALQDPASDDASKRKSFEVMKHLADEGHLQAMAALGYLYQEGIGTTPDAEHAATWYRKAAAKGHAISMYNLARLLVSDRVRLADGATDRRQQYSEAVELYQKAADLGIDRARSAYGIILMRGDYSTKPDPAKAVTYLEAAAKGADLEAMNALGTMYETGNGVAISPTTAEHWFRKAAEGGHVKARSNLAELLDPSSLDQKRRVEAIAWLLLAEEDKDVMGTKMMANKGQSFSTEDILLARKEAAGLRRKIRKNGGGRNTEP